MTVEFGEVRVVELKVKQESAVKAAEQDSAVVKTVEHDSVVV